MSATTPTVNPADLRPYASFAVLEYTGPDPTAALKAISRQLRKMAVKQTQARTATVLAEGIPDNWLGSAIPPVDGETLGAYALVCQVTRTPSWAVKGSSYSSVDAELTLAFQRNDLVAVHCPRGQVDALQRWLDGSTKPAFRRVDGAVLQEFLRGEARGLWLRGTHRRRATKADTKNLTGVSLANALDPFDDSSFALTSGRAAVDPARGLTAIEGIVGTTPRKSWIWNSRTESLTDFVSIAREALQVIDSLRSLPASNLPFPELAVELNSFAGVSAAYDAYLSEPDELAQFPDVSQDTLDRADALRGVLIDVAGTAASAAFTLHVGDDGAEVGQLRVVPNFTGNRLKFDFRVSGTPGDPARTAEIRDLLDAGANDLLNVYFESGHTLTKGTLATAHLAHHSFKGWQFVDFTGYDIGREKPPGAASQDIHDGIGVSGDDSLFGWLLARMRTGHLTCDDGANEVADFVHLDPSGVLTLVHIKASSRSPARRISAGVFEQVVSQASKNLSFLQQARLIGALGSPGVASPATWFNGSRVPDRSGLIAALRSRPSSADSRVVIIQPHHQEAVHSVLCALPPGATSRDLLRLRLVETMLNSTRGSAVGSGSELEVWASR